MITFAKFEGQWCVRMTASPVPFRSGQTVTVSLRNGSTKQVSLGAYVAGGQGVQFWSVAQSPARTTEAVGDLSRIIALFDSARQHLRFPAIVLDGFRVNVAGQRAREPGSLTVTSVEKGFDGKRKWFGRVTRAGVFEPSQVAPEGVAPKLRAFAADPAGQAAEYGRLHGVCCFCNKALRDERSTAVGYGPVCARHFGLPWGAAAVEAPATVPTVDAVTLRNRQLADASEAALDRVYEGPWITG